MKPEWQTFLIDAGAEFDDGTVTTFGNPEIERQVVTTGTVICDLSHRGLIAAYGDEAQDFLQSQLTSDVTALEPSASRLSAHLNPKGRVMALFRLFRRGETFFLSLPRPLLEPTLKRLKMYVLRTRVTLEDASSALVGIGLAGPDAAEELAAAGVPAPGAVDRCDEGRGVIAIRVPGPAPRFELYGELEPMQKLWQALNVRAAPVGAGPWGLLDIRAGVPTVYPATVEAFLPQMLRLEQLGGVSFTKGCYPGQEVVARLHYRGQVKRHMVRAVARTDQAVQPGDPVWSAAQEAGTVVAASPHPDGGHELLAVIAADNLQDPLALGQADGPPLTLLDLPSAADVDPA